MTQPPALCLHRPHWISAGVGWSALAYFCSGMNFPWEDLKICLTKWSWPQVTDLRKLISGGEMWQACRRWDRALNPTRFKSVENLHAEAWQVQGKLRDIHPNTATQTPMLLQYLLYSGPPMSLPWIMLGLISPSNDYKDYPLESRHSQQQKIWYHYILHGTYNHIITSTYTANIVNTHSWSWLGNYTSVIRQNKD